MRDRNGGFTPKVLAIAHLPSESATGWEIILSDLCRRGLEKIGLIVANALTRLEDAVGRVYSRSDIQRCVTHVKRRMLVGIGGNRSVRSGDTKIPKLQSIEHGSSLPSLLYQFEVRLANSIYDQHEILDRTAEQRLPHDSLYSIQYTG